MQNSELNPINLNEQKSLALSILPEGMLNWANQERFYTGWLRANGHNYPGFDTSKYILGNALNIITGDDNPYLSPFVREKVDLGDKEAMHLARWAQANIIERLDFESTLPEMPAYITIKLADVLSQILSSDWGLPGQAKVGYDIWRPVTRWVSEQYHAVPELNAAWKYSSTILPAISRDYNSFVDNLIKQNIIKEVDSYEYGLDHE